MFFLNQRHYQEILGYIKDKGYNFNMWAYARVDTLKRSQLELFKSSGVNWLGIGIESGSEIVRGESIKGGFSLTKIKNVINSTTTPWGRSLLHTALPPRKQHSSQRSTQ